MRTLGIGGNVSPAGGGKRQIGGMGAATQVSVEEYLRTDHEPDRDHVDGVLEERHLGQKDHSKLQRLLIL